MSRPPALVLEHLSKCYSKKGHEVPALRALSARVERGQVTALVGPNGSGKTTALRLVATLVRPTSGRALVFGRDTVTESSAVRRAIGVSLGAGRSFYWRLTARHNLAFFARLKGVSSPLIARHVDRLAAELDLERWLGQPARSLSRGTLARLSMARALLGDPGLLLLDEPFASLDGRSRELVWRALGRKARSGVSVLLATNDPRAAEMCDEVVTLAGAGCA